ncbi:MAG TPA: FAD-dependent oxidoreductase, partial [Clostridia bacterium]
HVCSPLDFDMASFLHKHLRQKGVKLILNNKVNAITRDKNKLLLKLKEKSIQTDMVINSIGVRPVSKLAIECGLEVNQRGAVIVNNRMQTNDPSIYAVGDLVEILDYITGDKTYVPLAGPAQKQARIAANNIAGIVSEYNGTSSCGIVKVFDKTIAYCGLNEKTLKLKNIEYEKIYTYTPSHPSYYPDSGFITIKLLFDRNTGKIFGAQIIGDKGVDKRADVLGTVIRLKGTVYDLVELELPYSPPYSSAKDPVNIAGLTALNVIQKISDVFHYEDLNNIKLENAELLDVRTKNEFEQGHIEGFRNIPLQELRQRINELDKNKTVYVNCFIGQRSYIAERILKGLGFNVYNFSGGYRLYKSIYDEKNLINN